MNWNLLSVYESDVLLCLGNKFTIVIHIEIISDNLAHDTVAVHECNRLPCNRLHEKPISGQRKSTMYITDCTEQHFENRSSFANLQAYEEDFGTLED